MRGAFLEAYARRWPLPDDADAIIDALIVLPRPAADHLDPRVARAGGVPRPLGRRGHAATWPGSPVASIGSAARADDRALDRRAQQNAPCSAASSTFPDVVEIVVEIPRGSRNKYEFDEEAGVFRLDRVLSSAVFYNFDYGFIEGTRAGDGDHTDALLIIDEPTFTGCHVWARPIGGLEMRDEKGFDFKILCVALGDPHQQHIERSSRSARTGSSRSSTSSRPTSCSRTRRSTSSAGATSTGRCEVLDEDRERYARRARWLSATAPPVRRGPAAAGPAIEAGAALIEPVRARPARRGSRAGSTLETLHLTLRFLGDAPPDASCPTVARRRARGDRRHAAFDVELAGAGVVPAPAQVRGRCGSGIARGATELAALADGLDEPLARSAGPPDPRAVPPAPDGRPARTPRRRGRRHRSPRRSERGRATGARRSGAERSCSTASHLGGGPPRHEPIATVPLLPRVARPFDRRAAPTGVGSAPRPTPGHRRSRPDGQPLPRRTKFVLDEDRIPRAWYNIAADLPGAAAAAAPSRAPASRSGPADLAPLFPMALIKQVVSPDREIEIPEPVREAYALYRPSPLYRAHRLEKALDTPAHIYYKYEGVSPSGSHKPNTALAAGLLQQGGGREAPGDRDRRRPVGERARVRGRAVRPRGQGLHGPRAATTRSRTAGC